MQRIPFVPIPIPLMLRLTKRLLGIGGFLSKVFPTTDIELLRADIKLDEREYLTIALVTSFFWLLLTISLLLILTSIKPISSKLMLFGSPLLVFMSSFFYIKFYPNLITAKKVKDMEKNLLFALRSMEVQVNSGISLFDSLVSISEGNYGLITEEFKTAIKKISTGKSEIEALEELILKNPSLYFRKIIWQITNSLRSGTDLSSTLKVIVSDLSYEKIVSIRKYGAQLNPMAMMYMMIAVIFPGLGVSFLMILSSFSSMQLTPTVFWGILTFTGFFQFMLIGMIKSKRPVID